MIAYLNKNAGKLILCPCIFLLLLTACKKNLSPTSDSEPISSGTLEPHKMEILFFPLEEYAKYDVPGAPSLILSFSTVQQFGCSNYGIALNTSVKDNELTVQFDSVLKYSLCLTSPGPAHASVPLPGQISSLVLKNGGLTDTYTVNISKEKVEITLLSRQFTTLFYGNINRYPENTFAYVCGTNINNQNIYEDFMKILKDSLPVTEFQFPEGRIPYPDSSSGHWKEHPSRFFRYSSLSDFEKAGQLLKNYTLKNIQKNSGVTIYLQSWDNRIHRSWMY